MPSMGLEGQVALVTGSSRGIGRAIAARLAEAGCDLAVHGREPGGASAASAEALLAEARALGRRAELFHADVGVKDEVVRLVEAVRAAFGRLDVLVLNAARAPFKESTRLLERDLRQLVETNLFGPVFCVQQALPLLAAGRGRIVFVSSLGSRFMSPQYPLGPIKAAMESMVRQWAEELRPQGVRANAVCAGIVRTDAFKTLRRLWRGLEALPEEYFVTPEEVASAVHFLVTEASSAINGQTIVADRGLSNRILRD
jgi:NAD(P)-dependent dehydrogenase (short-subunit alcohol dehydrogenase family)